MASLTVVGCAGTVPSLSSACSCYLVETDDFRLLLDLGIGAIGPLQSYVDPLLVDAVVISHAHGDHFRDLYSLDYLRERAGLSQVPVYGPEMPDVQSGPLPERVGPWHTRYAVGEHQIENWAVRLDDRLCYTGDTAPCPAVVELAQGCRVLLAEASGLDEARPPNHLTAGDAGRLAARARSELLILTHLRPWLDPRQLLAEAARCSPCPVVLATPGLRVNL